jgi:hypothetical protein
VCHGKSKFITAKANLSQQEQNTNGKSKLLTAKQKSNHWSAVASFTPLQLHVM